MLTQTCKQLFRNVLFEHTKFARMGYANDKMVYYSAGMERPSTTAPLE